MIQHWHELAKRLFQIHKQCDEMCLNWGNSVLIWLSLIIQCSKRLSFSVLIPLSLSSSVPADHAWQSLDWVFDSPILSFILFAAVSVIIWLPLIPSLTYSVTRWNILFQKSQNVQWLFSYFEKHPFSDKNSSGNILGNFWKYLGYF